MTLVVVLLGIMAGLAWFLPDDKAREPQEEQNHQSRMENPTPERS